MVGGEGGADALWAGGGDVGSWVVEGEAGDVVDPGEEARERGMMRREGGKGKRVAVPEAVRLFLVFFGEVLENEGEALVLEGFEVFGEVGEILCGYMWESGGLRLE